MRYVRIRICIILLVLYRAIHRLQTFIEGKLVFTSSYVPDAKFDTEE